MAVSFRCNFNSMYFCKVILFHLELSLIIVMVIIVFKNSYTGWYLFWSNLSSITVVFSWYFMKFSRKWSEEAPIFSKLQVYENIREGFSFSITLKADFCSNALLQIFSLMESFFIEIRTLLPVTLQKELVQVRFLGISRTNTLQRCI